MNIKIKQKHLITGNFILFIISFAFLEYSELFRMSLNKHWIYSIGHNWWFMVGIPSAILVSLLLSIYSICKVKKYKFWYFIFSLFPLILFIIFISI